MLWHRQAIFKSKGDKLCCSAECRIWTRGPRHQFASRLNARWQTDWAIEDQVKNLNSTARPYDQRVFSPLGPTVSWLSHLALAIYMFVVVNFDALAYIHTYIHTLAKHFEWCLGSLKLMFEHPCCSEMFAVVIQFSDQLLVFRYIYYSQGHMTWTFIAWWVVCKFHLVLD